MDKLHPETELSDSWPHGVLGLFILHGQQWHLSLGPKSTDNVVWLHCLRLSGLVGTAPG